MVKSRYTLFVENISSMTPRRDVIAEFERKAGPVLSCVKDNKERTALVEFKHSADAKYAWEKMDGFSLDGRKWKVDWATPGDYKFFDWKWTEGGEPETSSKSYKSRSVSPSRSD